MHLEQGPVPSELQSDSRRSDGAHLTSWEDWYRFAADVLGYEHAESAAYANLRSVEEQNRASRP